MEHVFLDFEMNPIPKKNKEAREIVRSEIIEIGAVKLDEQYQQVGRYSCYVRPEYGEIARNITLLTGITQADVQDAPPLSQALEDFLGWIGPGKVRVYSWSDSDRSQLLRECTLKGLYPDRLPAPFRRWMDFQRVYTRLMGLSRHSNLSLRNAMGAVDQDFSGDQHRAVDDAENSASLLTLVKDPQAFQERVRLVQSFFGEQPDQGTTLGDLFGDAFAGIQWADSEK